MPSDRVLRLQLDAKLAAARQRREDLSYSWAAATYTSSGTRRPEDVQVDLAQVDAEIAELEERLAELDGTPAEVPPPEPTAAPADPPAPAPAPSDDDLLTTAEAAAILRVSVKGLERMRAEKRGPPCTYIGRFPRYRRGDLRGR